MPAPQPRHRDKLLTQHLPLLRLPDHRHRPRIRDPHPRRPARRRQVRHQPRRARLPRPARQPQRDLVCRRRCRGSVRVLARRHGGEGRSGLEVRPRARVRAAVEVVVVAGPARAAAAAVGGWGEEEEEEGEGEEEGEAAHCRWCRDRGLQQGRQRRHGSKQTLLTKPAPSMRVSHGYVYISLSLYAAKRRTAPGGSVGHAAMPFWQLQGRMRRRLVVPGKTAADRGLVGTRARACWGSWGRCCAAFLVGGGERKSRDEVGARFSVEVSAWRGCALQNDWRSVD